MPPAAASMMSGMPPIQRPPLGSWTRLYALVVASAVAMWALLYWLTETFNLPVPGQ